MFQEVTARSLPVREQHITLLDKQTSRKTWLDEWGEGKLSRALTRRTRCVPSLPHSAGVPLEKELETILRATLRFLLPPKIINHQDKESKRIWVPPEVLISALLRAVAMPPIRRSIPCVFKVTDYTAPFAW